MGFGYEAAKRRDPRDGFVTWGEYDRRAGTWAVDVGLETVAEVESEDVARRIAGDLSARTPELMEWQRSEFDRSQYESAVDEAILKHSATHRAAVEG